MSFENLAGAVFEGEIVRVTGDLQLILTTLALLVVRGCSMQGHRSPHAVIYYLGLGLPEQAMGW